MTDGAKVSRGRPNESASMIVEGLHVFFLFVFFCFLFFLQKPVFGWELKHRKEEEVMPSPAPVRPGPRSTFEVCNALGREWTFCETTCDACWHSPGSYLSFSSVLLGTSEHSIDERANTISLQRAEPKEIFCFKSNLCKARKLQLAQAKRMVTRFQITLKEEDQGDNIAVPIPSVDRGRGDSRNRYCDRSRWTVNVLISSRPRKASSQASTQEIRFIYV